MHLLLHANATNNLQIFKLCKPLLISLPSFIKFQSQEKRMAKLWSPAAFRVLLTICCVPQIMLHSHVSAEEYYIRQPPRSVIQTPNKRSESDPQQVNTYNKKKTFTPIIISSLIFTLFNNFSLLFLGPYFIGGERLY